MRYLRAGNREFDVRTREPGWFSRVIKDTRRRAAGRPAWRRSSEVNADLRRLALLADDRGEARAARELDVTGGVTV